MLNANILCASEFALAIALTVFILLTVILAVLLISLAASKNFRAVFFREKSRKKKSTKKPPSVSEPAPAMPKGGVDTVPIDPPKSRRAPTRKNADDDGTPDFLNAIPTVPLGGFPQASPSPTRGKARQSGMRMDDVSSDEQGGTYTARMITITRARPSTPAKGDNKTAKSDKTDKLESAKPARTPKKDKK